MRDLLRDVHANTADGNISISTEGAASARTVGGSIRASMGAKRLLRDLEFETAKGDITLELPRSLDADLLLRASETMELSLPVVVRGPVHTNPDAGPPGHRRPRDLRLDDGWQNSPASAALTIAATLRRGRSPARRGRAFLPSQGAEAALLAMRHTARFAVLMIPYSQLREPEH